MTSPGGARFLESNMARNDLTVDERSSDFYIGRHDFPPVFVSRKIFEICSGSNLIFRCLFFHFFQVLFFSVIKRKANSTIEQQKCSAQEKRD